MDPQLLEALLYQDESEALDFKVTQYPFDSATNEQKSELLKDVLAFANAWRQSDAFILIGVEEVRGHRSVVRGISTHLLNQNLQQFVNSKTNRPMSFSYSGVTVEGLQIGLLTIPIQDRPLYLLKDFGRLKANTVYIRRGDTTAEASPDEVLRMGSTAGLIHGQPVLELEFADLQTRRKLGTRIELVSQSLEVPSPESLPRYGKPPRSFYGISVDSLDMENSEYYREIAAYLRDTTFLCPVGIAVANPSTTVAEQVVATLEFNTGGVTALGEEAKPPSPSTSRIPHLHPMRPQQPERVEVRKFGELYEVRFHMGTVQPGTTAWSKEAFYIGARQMTEVTVKVTISANNLRIPVSGVAAFSIEATSRKVEVSDLTAVYGGRP
jgi:hypothetical protein